MDEDYFPPLTRIGVGEITNCKKEVELAADLLKHLDINSRNKLHGAP